MVHSLFNVTRPTVPIFVRASGAYWIKGDVVYPVRRIYCVGRNYREHTIEMGGNPNIEKPFFFQKPSDAVVTCAEDGSTITVVPYPSMTSSLQHEAELIIAIGANDGRRIAVKDALDYVYGYAVGCDLTRRDLQTIAKNTQRPWDAAKGFDYSCPISAIVSKDDVALTSETNIELSVNGVVRQSSTLRHMIHTVSEIISNLSHLFTLQQGDLIMTGTPAGVGDLNIGDRVSIVCGNGIIPSCQFVVGQPV